MHSIYMKNNLAKGSSFFLWLLLWTWRLHYWTSVVLIVMKQRCQDFCSLWYMDTKTMHWCHFCIICFICSQFLSINEYKINKLGILILYYQDVLYIKQIIFKSDLFTTNIFIKSTWKFSEYKIRLLHSSSSKS